MKMFEITVTDTHYQTLKIRSETYEEAMNIAFAYSDDEPPVEGCYASRLTNYERDVEMEESYDLPERQEK